MCHTFDHVKNNYSTLIFSTKLWFYTVEKDIVKFSFLVGVVKIKNFDVKKMIRYSPVKKKKIHRDFCKEISDFYGGQNLDNFRFWSWWSKLKFHHEKKCSHFWQWKNKKFTLIFSMKFPFCMVEKVSFQSKW